LHLVGYLYYWQMGFNSVFKGLNSRIIDPSALHRCSSISHTEQNSNMRHRDEDNQHIDTDHVEMLAETYKHYFRRASMYY